MKRYGRKIDWNVRAVLGFGLAVALIFLVYQIPTYAWIWMWGPNTGHRVAGLSNGHYERRYPAIVHSGPDIGLILIGVGERLTVDYDVTIHEGTVSFAIWKWPILVNRPHHIGPRLIRTSGKGRIEFIADGWGFYRLYMYAHRWQGDVAVDWRTDEPLLQRATLRGG